MQNIFANTQQHREELYSCFCGLALRLDAAMIDYLQAAHARRKIFRARFKLIRSFGGNCGNLFDVARTGVSTLSNRPSGLRPEMSSEFEYRQLAAACLDLAKRTAVLADKTRLLLIAEAWFDLADRVTRKNGNVNGWVTAEHSIGALGSDGLPGSAAPSDRHSGTADDSNPASN